MSGGQFVIMQEVLVKKGEFYRPKLIHCYGIDLDDEILPGDYPMLEGFDELPILEADL